MCNDNGKLLKSEMAHLRGDLNRVLAELVERDEKRDRRDEKRDDDGVAMRKELQEVQIRCALRANRIDQVKDNTEDIVSLKEGVSGLHAFSRNWNIGNSIAAAGAYLVSIIKNA